MQHTIHQHHANRGSLSLLIALLLTVALALAAQIYMAGEAESGARRGQQDTGGQTSSPNPGRGGFDQQENVRQLLAKQYDKLYSDEASIRNALNLRGKTVDFLDHDSATNRWVIAESKASDLDSAWQQLLNRTNSFVKAKPGADFELRLYLDAKHYEILSSGGRIYNWGIRDGILGWFDEVDQWVSGLIEGVKVIVLSGG